MTAMRTRVAVVLDHPAQHFSPAFRELAGSTTVEVRVFYWSDLAGGAYDPNFGQQVEWDVDLLSGYDWWSPEAVGPLQRGRLTTTALRAFGPEMVLVFGWATLIARTAVVWSLSKRVPVLLYGDSTWQHSDRSHLRHLRGLLFRLLFGLVAGAVSTGTFNREFYIYHGMSPGDVYTGVCPADVQHYARQPDAEFARRRGEDGPVVIGYAGKLIPRKGVDELLEALAQLDQSSRWRAVVIGDGPERAALEGVSHRLGLSHHVDFVGFQNQSQMPAQLRGCDIVVVPSRRDMRVLVCTEAMAAGCLVVVSDQTAVHGIGDLIEDGLTGFVYPSGAPECLADLLRRLLDDNELRRQTAEVGRVRAHHHDGAAFARSVEMAAARAVGGRTP